MNKTKKVTVNMYNAIKIMIKGGATLTEIGQYMGISKSTVSYIKNSETYEEYEQKMYLCSGGYRRKMAAIKAKEEAEKKKEDTVEALPVTPVPENPPTQVVEHRQTVTLVANHYMAEEMKKQTELLTLINNKLTLIAEDLGCFKEVKENG